MATRGRKLAVRGDVQMVGYRRFVVKEAAKLGVAGYVRNLPDLSVEVVARAEEKTLREFIRAIRHPPVPAHVDAVSESPARVPRGLAGFTIRFGTQQEELQEAMGGMETQFKDYRVEFRGFAGRTDRNFKGLGSKIDGLSTRTDENFKQLGGKIDSFATRTDENFKGLGDKYGAISDKLSAIMAEMAEQTKKTNELLESFNAESLESRERLDESLRLLRQAVERISHPPAPT